ncbi:hypothetical protein SAMN05660909_02457 [Chitinophaga terrae (ex Kim and Jung 2007)]|uniref:Uncharacterized protein n=2 Tax=Chitinophaga terrae (ex Kim and Jung 2007) TaxID=408074 RepID=A0A1H4C4V7_9BACT|nr:hypothetical protein SAMN05660909_02457 [Chitinophaga terrae (ex Kim and Jung 2007)]
MYFCQLKEPFRIISMKHLVRITFVIGILLLSAFAGKAQVQEYTPPVLPDFSASIKTGKIQLDWISGFTQVKEIGIQRSLDSVLNFNTIGYASYPTQTRNAYLDNRPLPGNNYYRLFILFTNGRYMYSKTVLALSDSTIRADMKLQYADIKDAARGLRGKEQENKEPDRVSWHPSNYIYTTADGNVNIKLPDAAQKHYSVKFFESNGQFLFEIEHVKGPSLVLEKAIFLHAGWFNFEIYENGTTLKEKWSLFIPLNYKM